MNKEPTNYGTPYHLRLTAAEVAAARAYADSMGLNRIGAGLHHFLRLGIVQWRREEAEFQEQTHDSQPGRP